MSPERRKNLPGRFQRSIIKTVFSLCIWMASSLFSGNQSLYIRDWKSLTGHPRFLSVIDHASASTPSLKSEIVQIYMSEEAKAIERGGGIAGDALDVRYFNNDRADFSGVSTEEFSGKIYFNTHASLFRLGDNTAYMLAEKLARSIVESNPAIIPHIDEIIFHSCEASLEFGKMFNSYFKRYLSFLTTDVPVNTNIKTYISRYSLKAVPEVDSEGSIKWLGVSIANTTAENTFIPNERFHDFSAKVFEVVNEPQVSIVDLVRYNQKSPEEKEKYFTYDYAELVLNGLKKNETLSEKGFDISSFELKRLGIRIKGVSYYTNRSEYLAKLGKWNPEDSDWYVSEEAFNSADLKVKEKFWAIIKGLDLDESFFFDRFEDLIHDSADNVDSLNLEPTPDNNDAVKRAYLKKIQQALKTLPDMSEEEKQQFLERLETPPFSEEMSPELERILTELKAESLAADTMNLRIQRALLQDKQLIVDQMRALLPEHHIVASESVMTEEVEHGNLRIRFRAGAEGQPDSAYQLVVEKAQLVTPEITDELHGRLRSQVQEVSPRSSILGTTNLGLGIYGVFMGLEGAVTSFENGDWQKGTILGAQAVHGVGSLTEINARLEAGAARALGRAMRPAVTRVQAYIAENAEALSARALSRLGTLAQDASIVVRRVPIAGIAFGAYNIYEDLQHHNTLGNIDAGLDSAIIAFQLAALAQPELEAVVIALTVIRMSIDTYYLDIAHELDKLPDDADSGDRFLAVLKGIGQGTLDLHDMLSLDGQIFSAISSSQDIDTQAESEDRFFRDLRDFHSYMAENGSTVDFTSGALSMNLGDINFHLGEPGTLSTLRYNQYNNDSGLEETFHQSFQLQPSETDIVLGIGETINQVDFKKVSAQFLFIPVHSRHLIEKIHHDIWSLNGSYTGNSLDNRFIAVQDNDLRGADGKLIEMEYHLNQYHYVLDGAAGDDTFFLGPQETFVIGGPGKDYYHINDPNGHVSINNYDASDSPQVDTVRLPFNLDQYCAYRSGNDLLFAFYDGTTQTLPNTDLAKAPRGALDTNTARVRVRLVNYFVGTAYQHVTFLTADGLSLIAVDELGGGNPRAVATYATAMNLSTHTTALDLNLSYGSATSWWAKTTVIRGTPFVDTIHGNDLDNMIMPGGQTASNNPEFLSGKAGSDTYLLQRPSGEHDVVKYHIANYSPEQDLDQVIIPYPFHELTFELSGPHAEIRSRDGRFELEMSMWDRGAAFQHAVFISRDNATFTLTHDVNQPMQAHVLGVDFSHRAVLEGQSPQTIDANLFNDVRALQGYRLSPNHIIGNGQNNVIQGGDATDHLLGADGNDQLKGADGNDVLEGGNGDDTLEGGFGVDILLGGDGDDLLFGWQGVHTALNNDGCGASADVIAQHRFDQLPGDYLDGGEGQDTVLYFGDVETATGVVIDLHTCTAWSGDAEGDVLVSIENVIGSPYDDVLNGSAVENHLFGYAGDDFISPHDGNDYMTGGEGADEYLIEYDRTGVKVIDNFARDGKNDLLVARYREWDDFQFQLSEDGLDLVVTFKKGGDTSLIIKDWVFSADFRHLTFRAHYENDFELGLFPNNLGLTVINGSLYDAFDGWRQVGWMYGIQTMVTRPGGEPYILKSDGTVWTLRNSGREEWLELESDLRFTSLRVDERGVLVATTADGRTYMRRGAEGHWVLARDYDHRTNADTMVSLGSGTFTGIVGDTPMSSDTILMLSTHDSAIRAFQLAADGTFDITSESFTIGTVAPGSDVVALGDFDGSGTTDFILLNQGTGTYTMRLTRHDRDFDDVAVAQRRLNWDIVSTGDYNGDGRDDLLWRQWNGDVEMWFMDGQTVTSVMTPEGPHGNLPVFSGDFNGDGFDDLTWVGTNSHRPFMFVWMMGETGVVSHPTLYDLPSEMTVRGVGDFDGDGHDDLLFRNDESGDNALWLMNGAAGTLAQLDQKDPVYTSVTIGDYDQDGKADLFWSYPHDNHTWDSDPYGHVRPSAVVADGLQLFLHAGTVKQTEGSAVVHWYDASGRDNHARAMNSSETLAPSFQPNAANGQPALRFSGSERDGMIIADSLNLERPYTVISVDAYRSEGSHRGRGLHSRDVNWLLGRWGGHATHWSEGWVGPLDGPAETDTWVIHTAVGETNNSRYLRNGVDVTVDNAPVVAPGKLGIANNGSVFANEVSDLDVGEIIVYDRVLTPQELDALHAYLSAKYLKPNTLPKAGLQLALAADSLGYQDNAEVLRWRDLSGHGHDATPRPNAPNSAPTFLKVGTDDLPVVRFNGAKSDGMILDEALNLQRPYTVFLVDAYTSAGSRRGRSLHARQVNWLLGRWNGYACHWAEGWVNQNNTNAAVDTFDLHVAVGEATRSRYLRNGEDVTVNPNPNQTPGRLGLVNHGGFAATEVSDVDIAEILIYDRVLTTEEINQISQYLMHKYGLDN